MVDNFVCGVPGVGVKIAARGIDHLQFWLCIFMIVSLRSVCVQLVPINLDSTYQWTITPPPSGLPCQCCWTPESRSLLGQGELLSQRQDLFLN